MDKTIQSTQILLEKYTITAKKSKHTERGDLIDQFLDQLNPQRMMMGMKPLTPAFLSMKFSSARMTIPHIYQFFKDCQRAQNFSAYFWYAMRPKR